MVALHERLCRASSSQWILARLLVSILGQLALMSIAVGPVTHLMTCSLYATLNVKMLWCQRLSIPTETKLELEF